jgi:hypothetical protein
LRRMRIDPPQSWVRPTTVLGDWHVNLLLWRPQLIHCMNDRSLLSVLLPARDSASFPLRFRHALRQLLVRLGVSSEAANLEIGEMNEPVFAPTNNRSILGCMRDAELALAYDIESGRYPTLDGLQWRLTDHIHEPTGYRPPGEFAVELFSAVAHA